MGGVWQWLRKWRLRIVVYSITAMIVLPNAIALLALRQDRKDPQGEDVRPGEIRAFEERVRRELAEIPERDLRFIPAAPGATSSGGGITMLLLREAHIVTTGLGEEDRLIGNAQNIRYKAPPEFDRIGASLTRINDGTVMLAGGYPFSPTNRSAQDQYLFWPLLTEPTVSLAVPMHEARAYHSVHPIGATEIMLIGGESNGCAIASTERFDTLERTVHPASTMAQARSRFASAQLADGKILVAGGNGKDCPHAAPLAAAEIYDPTTNRWQDLPSMAVARRQAKALRLNDGRVIVAGGTAETDPQGEALALDTVEIWNPESNTWRSSQPMFFPRVDPALFLLADGSVLAVGGDAQFSERWNPATERWEVLDRHATQTVAGIATRENSLLLGSPYRFRFDGKPCVESRRVIRGWVERNCFSPPGSIDLTKGQAAPQVDFLVFARRKHTSIELTDGRIVVLGGLMGGYMTRRDNNARPQDVLSIVEIYDPVKRRSTVAGQLVFRRFGHQAFALPDGRIAVFGGYLADWRDNVEERATISVKALEIFDPSTGDSRISHAWGRDRPARAIAAQLPDGDLLIAEASVQEGRSAQLYRWSWRDDKTVLLGDLAGIKNPYALHLSRGHLVILSGTLADETSRIHTWRIKNGQLQEIAAPPRSAMAARVLTDATRGYLGLLDKDGLQVLDLVTKRWSDRTDFLKSLASDPAVFPPPIAADAGNGRLLMWNVIPTQSARYRRAGDTLGHIDVFSADTSEWDFNPPRGTPGSELKLKNGKLAVLGGNYRTARPLTVPDNALVTIIDLPPDTLSVSHAWRNARVWWALRQ